MKLEAASTIWKQTAIQADESKEIKKEPDKKLQMVRLVENLPCAPNAPGIGINIDTAA